ncbi:glycerophosphodiester phosphodiesterase [Alkalibacillus haloalkaliphilus]|uniref:Glycerophosphoryl diester phosphodiesterase n=1 Tax=Alkalibacillus haloalkaliphilus TaxID=94136 RepID=A0A511W417_9BACI|nr:glycerophosphodiester phosphodiesterase [Alkalibacillus haloalkaliphilus]GEN45088.1 glycerophosphoryl diester phosphodiesterase [Alkalibacillus haloalkaliphilus]
MSKDNKTKYKKPFSIGLTILGAIYIFLYLIPMHSVEPKAFFENDRPMVIAHQGGEHLKPSSTMAAFENAVELGVDVLETDLHISKDGYLINIHDPSVDRTTDGTGDVADLTLEELKQLDAGHYFEDEQGNHPYRGQGLELITVEEMFEAFPDERFIIEIKDTNPSERNDEIIERLIMLIDRFDMQEQVLIASFDQDIIESFQQQDPHDLAVAGGRSEIRNFVVTHKIFLRNLYNPSVDAVLIPTNESGFDLTTNDVISGADRLGLHVSYWTINDRDEMKRLLEAGADGIITDRPDLTLEVLDELGY